MDILPCQFGQLTEACEGVTSGTENNASQNNVLHNKQFSKIGGLRYVKKIMSINTSLPGEQNALDRVFNRSICAPLPVGAVPDIQRHKAGNRDHNPHAEEQPYGRDRLTQSGRHCAIAFGALQHASSSG